MARSTKDDESAFVYSERGPRYSDWKRVPSTLDSSQKVAGLYAALDDSSLQDVYSWYDEKDYWYRPEFFQTLEVDVPPQNDTGNQQQQTLTPRFHDIRYNDLSSWLGKVRDEVNTTPELGKPQPRLRLLISPRYRARRIMPISCPEMAEDLAACLNIPRNFPSYDNQADTHATTIIYRSESGKSNETNIRQMIIKTAVGPYPDNFDNVYFLALGHNSVTDSLTGLLVKQQKAAGLLDDVSSCVKFSSHPVLIAFLLFRNLVEASDDAMGVFQRRLKIIGRSDQELLIANDDVATRKAALRVALELDLDDDVSTASWAMRHEKPETEQTRGQLSGYLKYLYSNMSRLHSALESEQFESIFGLMVTLDKYFDRVHPQHGTRSDILAVFDQYELVSHRARAILKRRECSVRELQFQMQMIHNTLQRRTAALASEDMIVSLRVSSQMKAVAVLAMVFLPIIALATIFSMSPFFTTDDGGRISVSTDFWLFFVVAVPVTVFVMISYVAWIQRREFAEKWVSVVKQTRWIFHNLTIRRRDFQGSSLRSIPSEYRERRHDVSSVSESIVPGSSPNGVHDVSPLSPLSSSSSDLRRRHDVSLNDSVVALEEGLRRSSVEI